MKSAYELALERLEKQGIDRPDTSALTDEDREKMAEIRRRAEAKTAELEILHHKRLAEAQSYDEREKEEEEYRIERLRIEDDRDAKLARVRQGA